MVKFGYKIGKNLSERSFTMEKSTKRWISAGAVLAGTAAAGAAAHGFTKYMMDMAMDRNKPKELVSGDNAGQKIRRTPEKQAYLDARKAAELKLRKEDTIPVEIKSWDGIQLVGHLKAVDNPQRLIVAMHGWRSSWKRDFGLISDFWEKNHCTVLYAEQRGQNSSGGEYMGFGMLERYDCLDWAKWLHDNLSDTLPIYLAGVSMGASTVLMASCLEVPENVRGVMADCGFTSPMEIWKHIIKRDFHLSYSLFRNDVARQCRKKIQLDPRDCSAVEALRKTKLPVMFAHGTADAFVPVEMTYENYRACAGKKKLLIVPGAEHCMSYYAAREPYEKMTKEFWQECEA